ncbi:hypothetical protein [Nigerium massiliense]|uniref:hypothetical protein n=1 Tax=Nigerium massiliense TaxID=1522317 RepID=UPI0005905159|nr:hypothetical protein [Nigerium massiliense]
MTDNSSTFDLTTTTGWLNRFAAELRLRGATGAQTGDALAEVESFVADSGQTPQEAFGDPRAYAETVMPAERAESRRSLAGVVAVGGAAYLGAGAVIGALLSGGGPVPVRLGEVVAVGALAVVSVVLARAFPVLARTKRLWGLLVFLLVGMVLTVLPGLLYPQPIASVPAWASGVVGVALLALAASYLSVLAKSDPIRDPRRPGLAPLSPEEQGLVDEGRPVQAMRLYRQRTGASLMDARRAVER